MKNVGAGLCSLKAPGRTHRIWRCTFPRPGQDPPSHFIKQAHTLSISSERGRHEHHSHAEISAPDHFCAVSGLILTSCGSPGLLSTPTPIPPTNTPTPIPPTCTPAPPTATPFPLTMDPQCGTLVIQEDEPWFGETGLSFGIWGSHYLANSAQDGRFSELIELDIVELTIEDKTVPLPSNYFSEGSIHTENFGDIRVAVMNSQGCWFFLVTPEQLTMIYEWLQ